MSGASKYVFALKLPSMHAASPGGTAILPRDLRTSDESARSEASREQVVCVT
jgi:hypothetical protein